MFTFSSLTNTKFCESHIIEKCWSQETELILRAWIQHFHFHKLVQTWSFLENRSMEAQLITCQKWQSSKTIGDRCHMNEGWQFHILALGWENDKKSKKGKINILGLWIRTTGITVYKYYKNFNQMWVHTHLVLK